MYWGERRTHGAEVVVYDVKSRCDTRRLQEMDSSRGNWFNTRRFIPRALTDVKNIVGRDMKKKQKKGGTADNQIHISGAYFFI